MRLASAIIVCVMALGIQSSANGSEDPAQFIQALISLGKAAQPWTAENVLAAVAPGSKAQIKTFNYSDGPKHSHVENVNSDIDKILLVTNMNAPKAYTSQFFLIFLDKAYCIDQIIVDKLLNSQFKIFTCGATPFSKNLLIQKKQSALILLYYEWGQATPRCLDTIGLTELKYDPCAMR